MSGATRLIEAQIAEMETDADIYSGHDLAMRAEKKAYSRMGDNVRALAAECAELRRERDEAHISLRQLDETIEALRAELAAAKAQLAVYEAEFDHE